MENTKSKIVDQRWFTSSDRTRLTLLCPDLESEPGHGDDRIRWVEVIVVDSKESKYRKSWEVIAKLSSPPI